MMTATGTKDGTPTPHAAGPKLCIKCRTDVSHTKRLKDGNGHYWCETCGKADSEAKHSSKIKCSICHDGYSPDKIQMMEGRPVCDGCMSVGNGGSALLNEKKSEDRMKVVKLAAAIAMIAAGVTSYMMFM